jgi:chemotaxis protein MotB
MRKILMSKRRKLDLDEHEEHIDESWLIPYADILTLLLALFIVLFAASSINISKYDAIMKSFKSELTGTKIENKNTGLSPVKKTISKPQATTTNTAPPASQNNDPELDALKQKLEKYIADNHLQAIVTLGDTKRGIEISLKDYILYDSGKADLKESSFKTLNAIVGLIQTVPNPISIEGHTDNVPIGNAAFASNWELSSARAASVLHYFESKNVADSRLQFTGYGEFKPLFPNDTKEHRQANRRVNIVILRLN